ncbi:HlyC/CorC family transporter [Candidatus Parcubacteria bacterium]|nr:MAG: HlyC/CorC family transporter [Candidatus Parcubacteria bacterium]
MEIIFVLLLILLNGVFAMAEIAVVSARKSKLAARASEGSTRAQEALQLTKMPGKFLSTVQVGITGIGIIAGVFSGAKIAEPYAAHLTPLFGVYSESVTLGLVIAVIVFLSLVLGELVPKRIALSNPEMIAMLVARPMLMLSEITAPLVNMLSNVTDFVLNILGVKSYEELPVSPEEVRVLIREGAKMGTFELAEKDIVERTLSLGNQRVTTFMTPRNEIIWLDVMSSLKTIQHIVRQDRFSYYPVCRKNLDKVVGIMVTEDILSQYFVDGKISLTKSLHKPLFVPESMDGLKVLEVFKKSGMHMALIVDEYGVVQGLITIDDILEAIVGDIPEMNQVGEKDIIKRDDGTWLVDGMVTMDEFKDYYHTPKFPGERSGTFHTIGGFVMYKLDSIPTSGDFVEHDGYRIEVVDMDGNRVDKVLVSKKS